MPEIVIRNSTISGLHATRTSSHPDVVLKVLPDDTTSKDVNAMKVMVPPLNDLSEDTLNQITWPRNPDRRRFIDQRVRDVVGKKVGNVPANLCGIFRVLLRDGLVTKITAISSAVKPRASIRPPTL